MKYFEVQFTTLKEQHNVFLTQMIVIKCRNQAVVSLALAVCVLSAIHQH